MAKYINKDQLLENLEKGGVFDGSAIAQIAIGMVRGAPVVDVEPIIHAHWFVADEYLVCSHCGESYFAGDTRGEVKFLLECGDVHKRCHGCGAHMDEEAKNEK